MKTVLRSAPRLAALVMLALVLAACGNKGDLVHPTPAADKPVGS
jgi:predicted small lipoprotein YifL